MVTDQRDESRFEKNRAIQLCLWPSIIENISLLDYSFNIDFLVPLNIQ